MKGSEIRSAFLEYFKSQGHTIVPSSSLVPENDPTLLFNNAGMNQFKDCFLGGEKRSYTRATTCQKCLRVSGKHNDFENVGVTARHHTFFEMLGNFSFGDYFKKDAIKFGWEFSTKVLGLPKSKLWVTVFEKDDEAAKLWAELTDIDPKRILRMGEADNFWAMGETGPCGPCSEIFYYVGDNDKNQSEQEFRTSDGLYLEFWNLVFMQFNRQKDGTLEPLPKPAVDTGMGLERITSILQNVGATYHTDLLRGIITRCEELSGFKYDGSSFAVRDLRTDKAYARDVAMRVIADHSRAMAFLIADGVHPASDGRGYVLRRIIRRAIRHGRALEFKEPFLIHTTAKVIEMMGDHYHELRERKDLIARVVDAEERKFHETLDAGLSVLQREVEKLKKGQLFPGEVAFLLHDTYGFPLDLTEDALKTYNLKVDTAAFNQAMDQQKTRSRDDRKSQGISFETTKIEGQKTKFLGYKELEAEAKLDYIVQNDAKASFKKGEQVTLLFDATPFYAESGGQVADTGEIRFPDSTLRVLDTQKVQDGYFLHACEVVAGEFSSKLKGAKAKLSVDAARRARIRANHSATHLLHSGLRKVLGTHVKQAGSRVDDHSLRFDFSHFEPVTPAQLSEIQSFVNEQIRLNHEVLTSEVPIDEARKKGAMALFGEKYGNIVRMVEIGPQSLELCGGTHVSRSGDIGFALIASEGGVSAGVRRIESWSGLAAYEQLMREREERKQIAEILKSDTSALPEKVEKLLSRMHQLERDLETAKSKLAAAASGDLANSVRTTGKGLKVITQTVDGADADTLRSMVDKLRVTLGSGVVALGSQSGDSAILVAGVTSDLTPGVHAGNLIKEAAKVSGGKGGGRPDFAQAGGVNPAQLSLALDKIYELVSQG
ncbi:MAG: alanine--tRNA ligase [Deltaproteobacteria bacterium]|nr:alanine--tRNA ligase [Deltaproteobacteria bacterium]